MAEQYAKGPTDNSKLREPTGSVTNTEGIVNQDSPNCPACNLQEATVLEGLVQNPPAHTCGQ